MIFDVNQHTADIIREWARGNGLNILFFFSAQAESKEEVKKVIEGVNSNYSLNIFTCDGSIELRDEYSVTPLSSAAIVFVDGFVKGKVNNLSSYNKFVEELSNLVLVDIKKYKKIKKEKK